MVCINKNRSKFNSIQHYKNEQNELKTFFEVYSKVTQARGNSRPKLRPRLSDAAFDDLFFFINLFYQKQYKHAVNIGVAQVREVLL